MGNGLADKRTVVVAAYAGANDLCMIHFAHRKPGNCRMTVLALVRTGNMVRRFVAGSDAMAVGTTVGYTGVIKCRVKSSTDRLTQTWVIFNFCRDGGTCLE